jgi:imidazolonepropionase-like amidohydrolase
MIPWCGLAAGALIALLLAGGARGQERPVAVVDARVFTGEGVLPRATVVFRAGRIVAVGAAVRPPAEATVVDGRGRTLLPGLIDAHTHTIAPEMLEQALVFGVTTSLDQMTVPATVSRLRGEERAGGAPGRADLLAAGYAATAPGGHGTQYGIPVPTLTRPEEAAAFVAERVAEGSDWIKIIRESGRVWGRSIPTLDEPTIRALVGAAHGRGKKAVVHVATLEDARIAVRAGADGLVHLWVDSLPDDALVAALKGRGVFVTPTLTVLESAAGVKGGESLVADGRMAPYLGPDERAGLARTFPQRPDSARTARTRAATARLHAAGVRILAGSDAPNPGTAHGASLHRELELLVRAGLTPVQALRAATASNADAYGAQGRGRIAPGMRADLLLVAGDPTADIRATRAIERVWKAGVAIDREPFRTRVAGALAARGGGVR